MVPAPSRASCQRRATHCSIASPFESRAALRLRQMSSGPPEVVLQTSPHALAATRHRLPLLDAVDFTQTCAPFPPSPQRAWQFSMSPAPSEHGTFSSLPPFFIRRSTLAIGTFAAGFRARGFSFSHSSRRFLGMSKCAPNAPIFLLKTRIFRKLRSIASFATRHNNRSTDWNL